MRKQDWCEMRVNGVLKFKINKVSVKMIRNIKDSIAVKNILKDYLSFLA